MDEVAAAAPVCRAPRRIGRMPIHFILRAAPSRDNDEFPQTPNENKGPFMAPRRKKGRPRPPRTHSIAGRR
ncbi:hypothetical protein [Massilia phosphatilytica]